MDKSHYPGIENWNDQLYHIYKHETFTLCLVCKEVVTDGFSLDRNHLVSVHLHSSEHQESFRALFRMCFPDPSCDSRDVKCEEIVSNSVFDISLLLGNAPSYVCNQDGTFVCLICQENISKVTDANETVKYEIVDHLQSELHLNSIKENVCWVYRLNAEVDFIMFHKSVVYCSVCKQTLKGSENTLLQTAACHLQIAHHQIWQGTDDSEESSSGEDGISRQLEYMQVADHSNEQKFDQCNLYDKNGVLETLVKTQPLIRNNIQFTERQKSNYFCTICKTVIAHFGSKEHCLKRQLGFHFKGKNHQRKLKLLEKLHSESKTTVHSNETKKTDGEKLNIHHYNQFENCASHSETCIDVNGTSQDEFDCVLSQDVDRVLKQLLRKHAVLTLNQKYIRVNDSKFFCEVCQTVIKFTKNGTHLKKHCYSLAHNQHLTENASNYVSRLEDKQCSSTLDENFTHFDSVLSKFTENTMLMSHIKYISNNSENFVCLLCNVSFPFTSCGKYVQSHIFCSSHRENTYKVNCKTAALMEVQGQLDLDSWSGSNIIESSTNVFQSKLKLLKAADNISDNSLLEVQSNLLDLADYDGRKSHGGSEDLNDFYEDNLSTCPGIKKVHSESKSTINSSEFEETEGENILHFSKQLAKHAQSKISIINKNDKNKVECALKKLSDKKSGDITVILNQNYIKEKDNNFFCEVCQELIEFTKYGCQLKIHCYSLSHNQKLTKNATNYVSRLKYKHCLSNSSKSLQKFDFALSIVAESYPYKRMTSHLKYISHNSQKFVCLLCDKTLPFSETGKSVVGHFSSGGHRRNAYDVDCNSSFMEVQPQFDLDSCPGTTNVIENSEIQSQVNFPLSKAADSRSNNDLPEIQSDFSDLDSNGTSSQGSSEDLNNFHDDDIITCPECGESVEMYNENAEFSMQLHSRKHTDLSEISDNLGFEFQEDADYVCPVCQETILIFNRNIELSINRHFEDHHFQERSSYSECNDCETDFDLLNSVFDHLPESFKIYRHFIVMDGNSFFCKLCNCVVSSSKDVAAACTVLSDHMSLIYHKNKYKTSSLHLSMAVGYYNKQYFDQNDLLVENNVTKNLVKRQPVPVRKINTESKTGVTSDVTEMIDGKNVNIQNVVKNKVTDVLNYVSKKNAGVKLNKHYFREKDGNFLCEVCQKSITFTKNGSCLKSHCYSRSHNDKLNKNASDFVTRLEDEHYLLSSNEKLQKFDCVLSEIAERYPYNIMTSHLRYISSNSKSFVCILCNKSLKFSITGICVTGHFFSKIHTQNTYEINCNSARREVQPQLENNLLASFKTPTNAKNQPQSNIGTQNQSYTSANIRSKSKVRKILYFLSLSCSEVNENLSYLGVIDGHFYCKVCKKALICTRNGKYLTEHLAGKSHEIKVKSKM